MLTEIEWWGGLLFIWLAVYAKLAIIDEGENTLSDFVFSTCLFLSYGAVLLLYFYWRDSMPFQVMYLVLLCTAVALLVVDLTMNRDQHGESEDEESEDDELELERGWMMFGNAIAVAPYIIICGLGFFKAWPTINSLL